MENIIVKSSAKEQEVINSKVTIDNRNALVLTGVTKMLSSNENSVIALIKAVKFSVSGQNLHVEKLDINNAVLEISGTIDSVKFGSNDGVFKKIFK